MWAQCHLPPLLVLFFATKAKLFIPQTVTEVKGTGDVSVRSVFLKSFDASELRTCKAVGERLPCFVLVQGLSQEGCRGPVCGGALGFALVCRRAFF